MKLSSIISRTLYFVVKSKRWHHYEQNSPLNEESALRKRTNTMKKHEMINYVELPAKDKKATKDFFSQAFGWEFEDFGPEYSAFSGQGVDGGFFNSELQASTENGSALIIFYSEDLEATQAKIVQAGGLIIKPIFSFPGGRRFHFTEPSGNEFAVWSDRE